MDHVCIRLGHRDDVTALKNELLKNGHRIISDTAVAGRTIFIFLLREPFVLDATWRVPCLELPYPKRGHSYADGWEHVEFVLPCAENTMEALRAAFFERFKRMTKKKLKEFSYTESEPKAEGEQLPNPTISLKVGFVVIKFHARPIKEVVLSRPR